MKRPGKVYARLNRFNTFERVGRHAATIRGSMRAYESMVEMHSPGDFENAVRNNNLLVKSLEDFNKEARREDPSHEDITPEHILDEIRKAYKK